MKNHVGGGYLPRCFEIKNSCITCVCQINKTSVFNNDFRCIITQILSHNYTSRGATKIRETKGSRIIQVG